MESGPGPSSDGSKRCSTKSKGAPTGFSHDSASLGSVHDRVSVSSDWSIHHPPEFKDRVSVSSDWSIHHPPEFKDQSSDRSIHHPPEFKDRVSVSSDWSIHHPPEFKNQSSDWSIHHPPEFQKDSCLRDTEVCLGQEPQRDLDIIFKRLEENILRFVQQQLHRLHRVLDSDYPECSESEEEEQSREAVLTITMDFLNRMNQAHLAERLQNYTPAGVCRGELKRHLQQKFQYVSEGVAKAGNSTLLNQIYTELYITEGGASEVNQEHEVRLVETASWKQTETRIACEDIFKRPALTQEPIRAQKAEAQEPTRTKRYRKDQIRTKLEEGLASFKSRLENVLIKPAKTKSKKSNGPVRVVLTKGVAGVGKTVLTQKFSLDWAEGRANQELQLLFPFTFRELNVLRERQFSLEELLQHFFSPSRRLFLQQLQVLFILDGLDECRLPLDFTKTRVLTDPTESASVDVLLVNLIRGSLLPSARLWITTRPAGANQIPAECVSTVTEVRGFTDPQKEQYFRKRFTDEANTIISHIKSIRSLHIMSHIPVFCWILSTVLQQLLEQTETPELPRTLTQMYVHFLVVQTKVQNIKYHQRSGADLHWTPETRKMVKSLGKVAFEQLQKGNLIFYDHDLSECGLDAAAASVYSGVFTQVFREEPGLYQDKVYCFIHLSVQEFLAALHVHQTFFSSGQNLLSPSNSSETAFYRSAVDQALQSPNGHLDLFLRFLLGLSLPTNQTLLQGLLTQTASNSQIKQDIVTYIKTHIHSSYSHRDHHYLTEEKTLNLFQCLNELNDQSLLEEMQQYTREGDLAQYTLTAAHFSALCILIQSSSSDLDEFDLRKYCPSERALLQLLPVVKASTKALLSGCGLSPRSCGPLASVLSSSSLTHLDLSHNNLQDSGVELLCSGLTSAPCKLETLSLRECNLTEHSCAPLASVLSSSSLAHLDLSHNDLQDSGVELLCEGLKSASCRLQTLRLSLCGLSSGGCAPLALVLSSSSLTLLDLSHNDLQDLGVERLCSGLKSAPCRLQTLRLSGCLVSERGGAALASALSSAPSHLRELDLSYNHPGPSAELLTALRDEPHCPLQSVRLDPAGKQWMVPGPRKYSCKLSLDPNTAHGELFLSNHNQTVSKGLRDLPFPQHEDRFRDYPQVLASTGLRGRCYWEVDWRGDWGDLHIAVSHGGIKRSGESKDIVFGRNSQSWSLCVFKQGYCLHHNNRVTDYVPLHPERVGYSYGRGRVSAAKVLTENAVGCPSGRVGVFLDSEAGSLSFYEVLSGGKLSHIHTFSSSFTEPVFAGFWLGSFRSSVSFVSRDANK